MFQPMGMYPSLRTALARVGLVTPKGGRNHRTGWPVTFSNSCWQVIEKESDYIVFVDGKRTDTYLAENGMTAEKIDEEINSYIKTELILHGVAAAENVVLSEEEYDEFVNNYYAYYAQYMWGATKEQIVTYLRNQAFMQKVVYTVFGYCELTLKNAG